MASVCAGSVGQACPLVRCRRARSGLGALPHQGLFALTLCLAISPIVAEEVSFTSPGFPPSRMDAAGRVVEDWGTAEVKLASGGTCDFQVAAKKISGVVPAAEAIGQAEGLSLKLTAYRAPVWPSGVDVLNVCVTETAGKQTTAQLALVLPQTVRLGNQTAAIGGRAVAALPASARMSQSMRDWGYADDAVSLPGWARPEAGYDPAFKSIRAGLGGVPIHYRFKVEPGAKANVILGFCESHWDTAGQRPFVCEVEGAKEVTVDPLERWGQHKPGGLRFSAADQNKDGMLTVSVLPAPAAPDQNPILNAIWIFKDSDPDVAQVIAGKCNESALYYVDVGGEKDQSLYAGGNIQYTLTLAPRARQELIFLLAPSGGSVPHPDQSAWTPDQLLRSAIEVWSAWK